MKKNKKIVFLLLLIVFLFQASSVSALEILYPKVPGALTPQEIEEKLKAGKIEENEALPLYFKYFFNLSLIVVTIICIAVSIYGGVLFLISGGSPVTMADAKKWIFSGILGLVILFSSYLLLVTINPQLVIFEIPGITKPPEGPPPTISPPTAGKTIYQEIPIGTLVENILAKNIDCYKYDDKGDVEKELKNHDRLDCLKELAEAVRTKAEELKEKAEKLKELIDNCSCSAPNCVCSCPTCICTGDPCPDRFEINELREKIRQLVTGEEKGEEFLSIWEGIKRLEEAKKLLGEDLNNLIDAENLMKWDCQYGTILNFVKFFDLKEKMGYIDKTEFDNIDMRKYCIEFNCTEFEFPDDPKKKFCIKYELNPEGQIGEGRICEATTTPTEMEYYVFDGDPATFYCLTGEEIGAPEYYGYYPYGYSPYESLKTCAEQGGIPCEPGQICEGGYFVDSSDYGLSTGKFIWAGTKLVYGWHDRFNVDQILAAGFNTVVTYRLLDASDKNFLDESLQKGLWVIPYIGGFFPNNLNGAISYINTWKNHPAIGAWGFLDEPELKGPAYSPANQKIWYEALKVADPNHDFFTAFTSNPAHPHNNYNPNAFDHAFVDLYPINDECFRYGPGEWNGNWQGYMDYALNRWNSLTGGIGGTAIVQAYYAPESGMLNPSGYIGGMLNAFQAHGAGTQKDGYGMYAWGGTDGTYLPQDPAVLSEVTSVNTGYDWPHTSPGGEEAGGNALCCVGGACKSTP